MSPQTRDALAEGLRSHYESCRDHARTCCGMEGFTRTATTPDGSPITETSPLELGHVCLCGWTDSITTTALELIELAVSFGLDRNDAFNALVNPPKEDVRG